MKPGDIIKHDEDWFALPPGTVVEFANYSGGAVKRVIGDNPGGWLHPSLAIHPWTLVSLPKFASLADAPDGVYADSGCAGEQGEHSLIWEKRGPGARVIGPSTAHVMNPGRTLVPEEHADYFKQIGPFWFISPLGGWPSERKAEAELSELPPPKEDPAADEAFCQAVKKRQDAMREALTEWARAVQDLTPKPAKEVIEEIARVDREIAESADAHRGAPDICWASWVVHYPAPWLPMRVDPWLPMRVDPELAEKYAKRIEFEVKFEVKRVPLCADYTETITPAGPDPWLEMKKGATKPIGDDPVPYPDSDWD